MIQPNEIRIGNYVATICDEPEILKIEGIKLYDDDSDDDCIRLESLDKWHPIYSVAPIPISDEMLLKSGFEKTLDRFEYIKDIDGHNKFRIVLTHEYERYAVADLDFIDTMDIYHFVDNLHQLQNIYFILSGKELEINL